MKVISNTSPVINLAGVDSLDLLRKLYGNLIIPAAVFYEIAILGAGEPGCQEVQTLPWIATGSVQNSALVSYLRMELDAGEAEAIVLALELKAEVLLIDERRGYRVARRMGLACHGILGVLIEAKHQGLITAVKPLLDELITKAGFWVTDKLYYQVLQAVGEIG